MVGVATVGAAFFTLLWCKLSFAWVVPTLTPPACRVHRATRAIPTIYSRFEDDDDDEDYYDDDDEEDNYAAEGDLAKAMGMLDDAAGALRYLGAEPDVERYLRDGKNLLGQRVAIILPTSDAALEDTLLLAGVQT